MSWVADVIGYKKVVKVRQADCLVIYTHITAEHWQRIWSAAALLATTGWGPELYEACDQVADAGIGILRIEKIEPFDENPPADPHPSYAEIRGSADALVGSLHKAGWVHGDLALCNLGYRRTAFGRWEVVMFDYDTMHKVGGGGTWFKEWVAQNRGWDAEIGPDIDARAQKGDREDWNVEWLAPAEIE